MRVALFNTRRAYFRRGRCWFVVREIVLLKIATRVVEVDGLSRTWMVGQGLVGVWMVRGHA